MKLNKILYTWMLSALLILCLTLSVGAASLPRLNDMADLLTDAEEGAVLAELDALSTQYGMDIVIVTTNDAEGKSSMEYADDYFDYNGFGGANLDGAVLLINMDARELWISGSGACVEIISSGVIDTILDNIAAYASDGDYYNLCLAYAGECEYYIDGAINGFPFNSTQALIVALVVGLIVTFVVTGKMKGELTSVRAQKAASKYYKDGSMQVTNSRDFFLYRNVTQTEKSSDSDDNDTHTSSSGNTHSGGGRSF